MTYKHFFEEVKNYWGAYARPGTGVKTLEYVKQKVAEQYLDLVLGRLMLNVSTQYNHVPDISDIAKARSELAKEGAFEYKRSQIEHSRLQIVQLDEKGKEEIEYKLEELNKKMRWRESQETFDERGGNSKTVVCTNCGTKYKYADENETEQAVCPVCDFYLPPAKWIGHKHTGPHVDYSRYTT